MLHAYHEKKLFLDPAIPYSFRIYNNKVTGLHTIVAPHYHKFIEIIYCQKGAFELLLDGTLYLLYPGDMVLIQPMTMHTIRSLGVLNNQHIALLFQPELLYNTNYSAFESKYILPFTMQSSKNQCLFRQSELASTPIVPLLDAIVKEEQEKSYGFELAVRTHISNLSLWFLRYWHEKGLHISLPHTLSTETTTRLNLVLDYVEQNYAQEISLEDMSTLCNITYSYFSRFFKKHMGKNFKEYTNTVRIRKAEDLLVTTNHSITDIGTSVGFATTSYFIEQFKLHKNMTPKKYRSLYLKQL